jgi:hypothetical protein
MLMKKNRVAWGLVVLLSQLVVRSSTPSGWAASGPQLLETGEFHGDEVRARTGERWLGLYRSKQTTDLIPSSLRVRRVHDPIVDEHPWDRTGKRVSVNRRPDPILLVRGTDLLRPGRVTSVRVVPLPLKIRSNIPLKLSGVLYCLQVKAKGTTGEEISQAQGVVTLVLARGKTRQTLYRLQAKKNQLEAGEWNLVWAGDLDHDRKLDLYLTVSWHYNVSQRKLFLSSLARRGRLVREIAGFEIVGC